MVDRVVPSRVERMALEDAAGAAEERPVERECPERLLGVLGAARMEAAGARQKRAHAPLVCPHDAKKKASAHAALSVAKMPRSRSIMWGDGLTP